MPYSNKGVTLEYIYMMALVIIRRSLIIGVLIVVVLVVVVVQVHWNYWLLDDYHGSPLKWPGQKVVLSRIWPRILTDIFCVDDGPGVHLLIGWWDILKPDTKFEYSSDNLCGSLLNYGHLTSPCYNKAQPYYRGPYCCCCCCCCCCSCCSCSGSLKLLIIGWGFNVDYFL